MKSSRTRAFAAFFAIVAVLFAQLAVSAYACPGADGMRVVAAVEQAPPCDQHPSPEAPPPLCQAHCQQGDQSLDPRGAVPLAAFAPLPPTWLTVRDTLVVATAVPDALSSLLERPTGPPIAVRHCRFHI